MTRLLSFLLFVSAATNWIKRSSAALTTTPQLLVPAHMEAILDSTPVYTGPHANHGLFDCCTGRMGTSTEDLTVAIAVLTNSWPYRAFSRGLMAFSPSDYWNQGTPSANRGLESFNRLLFERYFHLFPLTGFVKKDKGEYWTCILVTLQKSYF